MLGWWGMRFVGFAAVALLVVLAASSFAAVPRQTGKGVTFSTKAPGALTGVDFQVHWQNPDDPQNGKPHSVSKVVLHYAKGTVIDTSVPERCTASDAQIMAQGAAACPPGSKLGGGTLETDNGSSPPTRFVHNTVQVFSNGNDLIFLLETQNPPTRLVAHTQISGNTTTTDIPPTPGFPPPEPSNALKDETLHFPPYTRNGKAYTRTPPTCPPVGYWTNTLEMTYQDGVTEKLIGRSPCSNAKPPGSPSIAITGVPTQHCTSEDFVAQVRAHDAPSPRVTTLKLDGKTIHTSSKRDFKVRVPEDLAAGTHVLLASVTDAGGAKASKKVSFRHC
jgi:hypothetical protein